jgi:hypothetical protein
MKLFWRQRKARTTPLLLATRNTKASVANAKCYSACNINTSCATDGASSQPKNAVGKRIGE